MTATKFNLKPIHQAYERSKRIREALHLHFSCMEVIEDKSGILVERYVTNRGRSLILFATPHWVDVFGAIDAGVEISALVQRINQIAKVDTPA